MKNHAKDAEIHEESWTNMQMMKNLEGTEKSCNNLMQHHEQSGNLMKNHENHFEKLQCLQIMKKHANDEIS